MIPDFSTLPPLPETAAPRWHEAWTGAVTRPSAATFQKLGTVPGADGVTAIKWVALSALGSAVLWLIRVELGGSASLLTNLVVLPVWVVVAVGGFALITAAIQLVAHWLGGVGRYGQLAYAYAAFYAPLLFIASIVAGSMFFLPLLAYWIVLHWIAVKAVHQLSGARSFVAIMPLVLGILLVVGIPLAALYMAWRHAGV